MAKEEFDKKLSLPKTLREEEMTRLSSEIEAFLMYLLRTAPSKNQILMDFLSIDEHNINDTDSLGVGVKLEASIV